jgi:hypothetical protein
MDPPRGCFVLLSPDCARLPVAAHDHITVEWLDLYICVDLPRNNIKVLLIEKSCSHERAHTERICRHASPKVRDKGSETFRQT